MEERKARMNTAEAAAYLRISVSWLYQLVTKEEIPYHQRKSNKDPRTGTGRRNSNLWFYVAELDAWRDSGVNP